MSAVAKASECPIHGEHGGEAEELRAGLEELITDSSAIESLAGAAVSVDDIQALLDRVDARDSLAFRERKDNPARVIGSSPVERALELLSALTGDDSSRGTIELSRFDAGAFFNGEKLAWVSASHGEGANGALDRLILELEKRARARLELLGGALGGAS